MSLLRPLLLAGLACSATLAACSSDKPTQTVPLITAVRATVKTTGPVPDSNGYKLVLDDVEITPFAVNDSIDLGVPPGSHSVTLHRIPTGCTLSGAATVDVPRNQVIGVDMTVRC